MYDNKVHSVPDRIVSVRQPFLRPIVRGKAGKPVEFGAKLDISVVAGGQGWNTAPLAPTLGLKGQRWYCLAFAKQYHLMLKKKLMTNKNNVI